jgi:hypothetical protein
MKIKLTTVFIFFVLIGFSQLSDTTVKTRLFYEVPEGFELTEKQDSMSIYISRDSAIISIIVSHKTNSLIEVGYQGAMELIEMNSKYEEFKLLHNDFAFTIDGKEHFFTTYNKKEEKLMYRGYLFLAKVHDRLVIYSFECLLDNIDEHEKSIQYFINSIEYMN